MASFPAYICRVPDIDALGAPRNRRSDLNVAVMQRRDSTQFRSSQKINSLLDFAGLLAQERQCCGAEGGTRTPTGFPTTPSRWRVCQFHHFGTYAGPLGVGRGTAKLCRADALNYFKFTSQATWVDSAPEQAAEQAPERPDSSFATLRPSG